MPASRWRSFATPEPDREYLAFASRIPIDHYRATVHMFRGAGTVRKQLASTPGLLGYSLLAQPLAKHYATLSLWEDEIALQTFAHNEPHQALMNRLAADMGTTRFVRWTLSGADTPPRWDDALQRLH